MDHLPPPSPTSTPDPMRDYWLTLGDILMVAMQSFAPPSALAEQRVMKRKDRSVLLAWLRGLEALARRLLLILAAQLKRDGHLSFIEGKTRLQLAPSSGSCGHGRGGYGHESSEFWNVPVALSPRLGGAIEERLSPWYFGDDFGGGGGWGDNDYAKQTTGPATSGRQQKMPIDDDDLVPTQALADRLEALIRIVQNPEPYAVRLGQTLLRQADQAAALVTALCGDDDLAAMLDGMELADHRDPPSLPRPKGEPRGLTLILREIDKIAIEAATCFRPSG